MAYINVTV